MVGQLKITREVEAKPTQRVWIPKHGRDEKRPLGIPTIYDCALQGLVKQALEPEWEALMEANSYGFRSGRGCHDAIEAIFNSVKRVWSKPVGTRRTRPHPKGPGYTNKARLRGLYTCIGRCTRRSTTYDHTRVKQKPKWVLDADIAMCFDRINHSALLNKLNSTSLICRQIRAWLKAGVIDAGIFQHTNVGTPQGGVISPLLANIALHGLEETVMKLAHTKREKSKLTVVRYADDFVIMHDDRSMIEQAQGVITEWLQIVQETSRTFLC